jgi:hypothetical protein
MLMNLNTYNLSIAQKSTTTNTEDWVNYTAAREQLFGPHTSFRSIIAPSDMSSKHLEQASYLPGYEYCRLVISTILNLALLDHGNNVVMATVYMNNLMASLSMGAIVDAAMGKWQLSIETICAIIVTVASKHVVGKVKVSGASANAQRQHRVSPSLQVR